MSYNVRDEGDFAVVELTGDVDLSCSPQAREIILDRLGAARNVLVELSAVTYIDSSGIASLVEGYQTAEKNNLEFGLVSVSEPVMRVLQLARLDTVFSIHSSVADRLQGDG